MEIIGKINREGETVSSLLEKEQLIRNCVERIAGPDPGEVEKEKMDP